MQLNGVQLNSKIGMDFNTQYSVPDTGLTNNTTIANHAAYNVHQVKFEGTETGKLPSFTNSDIFQQNGLKNNISQGSHKLFLAG